MEEFNMVEKIFGLTDEQEYSQVEEMKAKSQAQELNHNMKKAFLIRDKRAKDGNCTNLKKRSLSELGIEKAESEITIKPSSPKQAHGISLVESIASLHKKIIEHNLESE